MTVAGKSSPVGGASLAGTAPLTFTSAAPTDQVDAQVQLLWDFDNDGDWDQAVEDITAYVLSAETTTGRDHPSNLTGKAGPGKLRFSLNNTDDRFSYFNTGSPLNAAPFSLKTGRRVRVQTTDGVRGASLITYVGIGAVAVGNNASVVPALPTGLAVGDLMLCVASIRNSGTGTVNTPSGWGALVTTGNLTLLGRYYQTGDTAPTVTFAGGVANATTMAQIAAFRGTHQTLSHVVATSATQLNGSAQNITTPARTIAEDNTAVLAIGWKQDDWTSVATLAGFTEISDSPTVTGDDAGMVVDYQIQTTATNIGATSFTVTGGANAISRAMVVALRPAVDITDPVLLARDRFERSNNMLLGTDELGTPWTIQSTGGYTILNGTASANDDRTLFGPTLDVVETLDVGTTDHYVQAAIPHIVQAGVVGLIVRFLDTNNYTRAYYSADDRGIKVEDIKAGVTIQLGTTFLIEGWDGMTLGLGVVNQTVTVYLGGFPLQTYDLNRALTGTEAGLYGNWNSWSDLPPAFDDFFVWDHVAADLDGVLWTGYVKTVDTSIKAGDLKIVTVDCEGPLAAAAVAEIPAPRITRTVGEFDSTGPNHSVPATAIMGDCMARAMMLHPPHPITGAQTSRIGPVALADGKALDLARAAEVTELGFIKETQQGQLAFEDRTFRTGDAPQAWFTDTTGSGQFFYSDIDPLDQQAEIINQANAKVAATCPTVVSVDHFDDEDNSALIVSFTMPAIEPGQLAIAVLACSADSANVEFGAAPPWKVEHNIRQQEGNCLRIFSLIAEGHETGQTMYFYKGSGSAGSFFLQVYVIDNWFGTNDGIKVARVSTGTNSYPLTTGWSRAPALYILFQGIIGATSAFPIGTFSSAPPVGYLYSTLQGGTHLTGTPAFSTAMESIYKTAVLDTEQPRVWTDMFADYLILNTALVAVRGYDGPLTPGTVDNPKATGGQGLFVNRADTDSQVDHNLVRSNPDVPVLHYTEADAQDWADQILAEHADDRPIITLSFWATKNAGLREQAMRRRVSDRISVTATGNAGLGISGDFRIETIHHHISNGGKLWQCQYELSPA